MELDSKHLSKRAQEDYKLVQKALKEKDQEAYAMLMDKYKNSVYYMLLKMVKSTDFAEDLTMETFGKAFKNLDQYVPRNAFSTWLFTIATNNCIDFIRRKKEYYLSLNKYDNDPERSNYEVEANVLNPEDQLIVNQRVKMLRRVIEKLRPQYKMLIELRYFGGYSYQEIADELNIPLGTVKAQLSRAREFIHDLIKAQKDTY